MTPSPVSLLHAQTAPGGKAAVLRTLDLFPEHVHTLTLKHGVRVRLLLADERYSDASPELARMGAGVDEWPTPPAGLFLVAERTVYLRSCLPMAVAHEYGHALDLALGGGVYRSSSDPALRRAFSNARAFVTPYAATGVDEYFAEGVRAWVGANDARSSWPVATRERLAVVDPDLYAIIQDVMVPGGPPPLC